MDDPPDFARERACAATMNPAHPYPDAPKARAPRGFALVATLMMMILLVVIAVGLLSLSAVSLRTSGHTGAAAEARANARLGLMMALGELQKYAGPDQRVTAEADILSTSGFYKKNRDASRKHYLGVYSTQQWHERDAGGVRKAWQPYNDDRNKDAFQNWLVSGNSDDRTSLDFATQTVDPGTSVEVVGTGTVGGKNPEDLVRVPYLELKNLQGKTSGRLAWWVGDQGVKARVNLADLRRDTSHPKWTNKRDRVNPVQMGMENVTGFETIGMDPANVKQQEELLGKVISYAQVGLFNGAAIAGDDLKSRYHDVTACSRGVLADVALGGLKRDLSLPFELPDLNAPRGSADWSYTLNDSELPEKRDAAYTSMREFNNSGDKRSQWVSQDIDGTERWPNGYRPHWWSKSLGYVFSYPGGTGTDTTGKKKYLRGTNWDMLRNHYRLYKREFEKLPPSDPERQRVMAPSTDRTWLVRSYDPPSPQTGSRNQTPLTLTYVGEFGPSSANPRPSDSLLNPFYSYGNAVSRGNRYWNNREMDHFGLTPVLTRLTLVVGTYGVDTDSDTIIDRMVFTVDAVGTLWNPYNVAIEVESIFSDIKLDGLKMNAKRDDNAWSINLPFSTLRLGVTEEKDPNYPFGTNAPSKLIRLEPGEVRTYSLNYPQPKNYFAAGGKVPGSFVNNNWKGGLFGQYSGRLLPAGRQVEFTCTPDSGSMWMQNYIGYFHSAKGAFTNPFASTDFHDLPQISGVVIKNSTGVGTPIQKKVTVSEGADKKTALMTIDFKLRSSGESLDGNGIAREFDPRSIVNHIKATGPSSKGDIPPNWDVEIQSISDYDQVQLGIGAGGRNNGFWGSSHQGDGETHVVYYEVPDAPIASIAGFQHLQAGAAAWDQPYAIGGSFAPKKLNQNEVFKTRTEASGFENVYYESSYLLNSALWDRYYFTGLSFDDPDISAGESLEAAEDIMYRFLNPSKENPLGNRRLSLSGEAGDPPLEELTHYRWIARHLMLDGAFNVNSTRVEAWKAWLSSLKGADLDVVNPVNGNVSKTTESETPMARAIVVAGKEGEEWRGYVSLSDSQVKTLAENIVEEVKLRGPFLSVADFINRRISDGATGKEGALQAALRASSLDLGSGVEEGIAGTLRQGDILAGLGASITARSDTFVVRAYGDSLDAGGNVLARAWCEAVVQRMPTPVGDTGVLLDMPNPAFPGNDPAGIDDFVENTAASGEAKRFGRKFRIVSFRWLSKEEV